MFGVLVFCCMVKICASEESWVLIPKADLDFNNLGITDKPEPPPGFGQYKIEVLNMTEGIPLKKRSAGTVEIYMKDRVYMKGKSVMLMDIDKLRCEMKGYQIQNSTAKLFIRYTIKDMCDHFFFRSVLNMIFPMKDKCLIKKGEYTIPMTQFNEFAHGFLGDNFFYGRFAFVTNMHSRDIGLSRFYAVIDLFKIE